LDGSAGKHLFGGCCRACVCNVALCSLDIVHSSCFKGSFASNLGGSGMICCVDAMLRDSRFEKGSCEMHPRLYRHQWYFFWCMIYSCIRYLVDTYITYCPSWWDKKRFSLDLPAAARGHPFDYSRLESSLGVGTNRSYADVVRGTTGKSSNMTDAVRQPTVNGKW
jgi:hypothetical protein